jgi:hypothetical protein
MADPAHRSPYANKGRILLTQRFHAQYLDIGKAKSFTKSVPDSLNFGIYTEVRPGLRVLKAPFSPSRADHDDSAPADGRKHVLPRNTFPYTLPAGATVTFKWSGTQQTTP